MTHTREPWRTSPGKTEIWNGIGRILLTMEESVAESDENAQRIVECVNCMAGVADPANAIAAAREALEWTLGQAEELLGAHTGGPYECAYRERIAQARAALALLKGVQP